MLSFCAFPASPLRPRPPPPPRLHPWCWLQPASSSRQSLPPFHRMSILGHLRQQVSTARPCSYGGSHPRSPSSLGVHDTPKTQIAKYSRDRETQDGRKGAARAAEAARRLRKYRGLGAPPPVPQWLRRDVIGLIHKKCCYKSGGCGSSYSNRICSEQPGSGDRAGGGGAASEQ